MVNKSTSDLPTIFKYDFFFTYKLLLNKEKLH